MTTLTKPDRPDPASLNVLASVFIFPGQVIFRARDRASGQMESKAISKSSLRSAITGLDVDTGWLPTDMHLLRLIITSKATATYVYMPPQMATIRLASEQATSLKKGKQSALRVPLPGLIFATQRKSYSIWAVRAQPETLSGKTRIYFAPFPNIDHAGVICWGGNRYYDPGPANIHKAWTMFLRSPFSTSQMDHKVRTHVEDCRKLWSELAAAAATVFPEDELMPTQHTLDELFNIRSQPHWMA